MAMQFRVLDEADLTAFRTLFLEMCENFPLGSLADFEEASAFQDERFQGFLKSGTRFGIFDGEEMLGFCGMGISPMARLKHCAEIGPFFVTQKAQGTGAARELMQGVVELAKQMGAELIQLWVDAGNHRAISFYEKFGFKLVATVPDTVRINGEARDDHIYQMWV